MEKFFEIVFEVSKLENLLKKFVTLIIGQLIFNKYFKPFFKGYSSYRTKEISKSLEVYKVVTKFIY